MKFTFLLKTSVQIIILILYLSTLYGRIESRKSNKTNDTGHRKRNYKDKINVRFTDRWFNYVKEYPNSTDTLFQDHSTESDPKTSTEGDSNDSDYEDKPLEAGFGLSKPKPWRKDDAESVALNEKCEIVVDPKKPAKPPAPQLRTRKTHPALKYISAKGCGESDVNNERVVNGKDAKEGAYPWMVAILKGGDPWCGGSIINERWILTAGHCFMKDQNNRLFAIRVGTINRNSGTTYKIEKVIVHERFHLDNMFNSDIALMKVNRPIKMGKLVRPICLPPKAFEDPHSNKLLVTGWGQTSYENRDLPTILQEVLLNMVSIQECSKKYLAGKNNKIYFSQICTWNKGQDSCQGDSGAPAIEYRNKVAYQIGIVSYGSTCADEMPGVYTKVTYFIDWILRKLDEENKKMTSNK